MKRPPRNRFDEQDALTGWRRVYAYLRRAGVTDRIKRGHRRWERRQAQLAVAGEVKRPTYYGVVRREDGWYVATVIGVGVTQGRDRAEARYMAHDLVESVMNVDDPVVHLVFRDDADGES